MTNPTCVAAAFWGQVAKRSGAPAFLRLSGASSTAGCWTEQLTWAELGKLVAWQCQQLGQRNIRPGDSLASWFHNSLDWIVLDIACQTLGIVHAAIDAREPEARVQSMADRAGAKWLVAAQTDVRRAAESQQDLAWRRLAGGAGSETHQRAAVSNEANLQLDLAGLAHSRSSDAIAQILFTSGSSGQPKGVRLTHGNLLSNALAKLDAAPQTEHDLRLNILPFSHAYARTCELSTWILSGGQLALARNWAGFCEAAAALEPSLVNVVPYLAHNIADLLEHDPAALGRRLRLLQVGGAALPEELFYRLARLGLPPLQGYGLTEAGPVVCSNRAGQQRPGSVGLPVQGVDIRVDHQGLLYARGPGVMPGYLDNPSGACDPLHDQWLATGDLAHIAASGHVTIHGRLSQQIVLSTGYKLDPAEVERRIEQLPWVRHAVVLGDGLRSPVALVQACEPDGGADLSMVELRAGERRQGMAASQFSPIATKALEGVLGDLPSYCRPRTFALLDCEMSLAAGTLTAKGTVRRSKVIELLGGRLPELLPEA